MNNKLEAVQRIAGNFSRTIGRQSWKLCFLRLFTIALVAVMLAGCGGKSSAQSTGSGRSSVKENPATDFQYDLTESGDGIAIRKYIGKNGEKIVIPAKIEGYPVMEVLGVSFFSAPITSVVIPDTVTRIGGSAFQECKALKEITLPKSLKIIESHAFMNSGLTSIVIPEGVTEIQTETFLGCANLTSVTLPESLERIYMDAFKNCASLTDIKMPSRQITYGIFISLNQKFLEEPYISVFDGCPKLSLAARKAITDSGYKASFF
ncbi:MAG: leucine-rich repeat domain-containing protein [Treponema sp.]|jgi:hypothetical protein|nr:leucine-rich repeat domain-containing protein [Treponema sp.]